MSALCEQNVGIYLTLGNNRDNSHHDKSGVFHEEVELDKDKDKDEHEHSRRMAIHYVPDDKACTHSNCYELLDFT